MFCGGGPERRIDRKDRLKGITKEIKNKQNTGRGQGDFIGRLKRVVKVRYQLSAS
jgi:hypothetical protein